MNISSRVFLTLSTVISLFAATATLAFAAPVRTYGGVNGNTGNYYLRSDSTGNGDLQPGTQVTVDSYVFQCRSHGTAACSTEWNSDATLVNKFQNTLTVPQMNQSTEQITHNFTLPYGQCGRVQYDQGIVGISGAIGGWVYDFGVDCGANTQPAPTCSAQQPLIQFRTSSNGQWMGGSSFSNQSLANNQQIDVNCFAKNGTALLEGGYIDMVNPSGQTIRVSNTPELRNYTISQNGQYRFTCGSTTMTSCVSTDTFNYNNAVQQQSSCNNLQVTSGNNSLVPATINFQANGSDNLGNIQQYHYFFGDGQEQQTTSNTTQHQYTSSGTFYPRVDVMDSRGNWKTSASCETTVTVQSAPIESQHSGCSDLFVTVGNGGQTPSTVDYEVTGYDNKGNIQNYRVDFGNGVTKDSSGRTFEQIYSNPGTYTVKAYVQDSQGNWVGGSDACNRTVTITSNQPLTTQPSTGTPTILTLLSFGSGAAGVAIQFAKRKLRI